MEVTEVNPKAENETEDETEYKFPEEHKREVEGLAFLGYLTKTFKFKGHKFTIKTLTNGDLLRVFELAERWEGALGQNRALGLAEVSAALLMVDGEPLVAPLADGEDVTLLEQKFNIVKEWFPAVTDHLFTKVHELVQAQVEVLQDLD